MDQLLVALDVETGAEAIRLADRLRGTVGGFKIGNRLFTAEGPAMVRTLTERGDRVFLDLKYHDIPNTVGTAVTAAASLGVWMVNVHAAGGRRMMEAAAEAARTTAAATGRTAPLVIAVTVLTSLNAQALADVGVGEPVMDHVVRLALLAKASGLDGVVASPQETRLLRAQCGSDFVVVTPGIRGGAAAAGKDDQERTMTPGEAMAAGSSYLVVGRPITGAPDPRAAAARIVDEIRGVTSP